MARLADDNGKELVRISDGLFKKKRPWDELCQELAENFYPMRADFTTNLELGNDFALDLMDSYPVMARHQLGDSIEAMLRQGSWFSASSGDEELDRDPAVARSLEHMTKKVKSLIGNPRSHTQRALKIADQDWVTFGANVLTWEENMARNGAVLKAHHPRDNAWMENVDGEIDTNFRKMQRTAREVVTLWEKGRWREPHQAIKRAAQIEPDKKFAFRHCLMPVDNYMGTAEAKRLGKNFVSVYFDVEHQMTMRESPMPWFNYIINRWWVLGDCPWGYSPVSINTLPDGRMTQALTGMVLEQGEKALDPPIIGAGDVFRNDINLWTSGFTMVDLSDGRNLQDVMTVVDTAKNMPVGFEMKADLRSMIAEGFLLNKLMLPNTRDMTAFESSIRVDEFRRAALPFFSPIESEYNSRILSGALEMLFGLRALTNEDVPVQLSDREAQWGFISPLNEAEGQKVAASFRQVVADVASVLDLDPTARTQVNWGEALADALAGDGAKPKWLPTEDEREVLEEENAKLRDANNAADALQKGAGVAADVANSSMALQQAGIAV